MTYEPELWHEVQRRLSDGTNLRTAPVMGHPELVNVMIFSASGYMMYSGTMTILDALGEIPYQLDRARAMETEILKNQGTGCPEDRTPK